MLREISKVHVVTYLSLLPEGSRPNSEDVDDSYASEKIWIQSKVSPKHSIYWYADLIRNIFLSKKPYCLIRYQSKNLTDKLREFAFEQKFDFVVCDFLAPALNFLGVRFSCPVVLFQHNIEAQIWKRLMDNEVNPVKHFFLRIQYKRMKQWEQRLSMAFDGVITVSPDDTLTAVRDYGLNNVLGDVPTGVAVEEFSPPPTRQTDRPFTMGFLGSMDWMPNIDACLCFAKEVFPRVRDQVPDCIFQIIGRNPANSLIQLANNTPGVEVTGTVAAVQPFVHRCDVIVVPLRAGGGTRIKIYEAMAMGVPVVSTTIGAEGLAVTNGADIVLVEDFLEMAEVLVKASRDPLQLRLLATRALKNVQEHHSWLAAASRFMELCKIATSLYHQRPHEF